jgi:hypothetical protein
MSFKEAFDKARAEGKKTFKWKGKLYNTKVKGEDKAKPKVVTVNGANHIRARGQEDIDSILGNLEKDLGYKLRITGGDRLDKKHNKKKGGANKSWHLKKGGARDIGVSKSSDKVKDDLRRFKRLARRRGLSVLDESQYTRGTGKHLHVDMRKNPSIARYVKPSIFSNKLKWARTDEDKQIERDADMELAAMQKREDLGFPSKDYGVQFGPYQDKSKNQVPVKQNRGIDSNLMARLSGYAMLDPESENIKEGIKAVDETVNPEQAYKPEERLASMEQRPMMMGAGVVGAPRKKKDEEVAQDILQDKAADMAVDTALKKREASRQVVKQNPEETKQVVDALPIDEQTKKDVKKDIGNFSKGKPRDSVTSQFTDALTYFLPTLIGGLGGLAFGGEQAAIAGAEAGTQLGAGFREFNLKERQLAQQNQQQQRRQIDVTNFVDQEGNPVTANLQTGAFTDLRGNPVNPSSVQRTNIYKQKQSIGQRKSEQEGIQSRFMARFNLDKAKASQLTDKQVTALQQYDDVLDSIDRISALKGKVNTGRISAFIGNLAELTDMQPEGFTEIKAETNDALAKYVKSISGAQVSELEAERLGRILPSVEDNDRTFQAKLKIFKQLNEKNKDNFLKAIKSGQPLKKVPGLDEALEEIESLGDGKKAPYGETVERNGKTYRWNATKGKYVPIGFRKVIDG